MTEKEEPVKIFQPISTLTNIEAITLMRDNDGMCQVIITLANGCKYEVIRDNHDTIYHMSYDAEIIENKKKD